MKRVVILVLLLVSSACSEPEQAPEPETTTTADQTSPTTAVTTTVPSEEESTPALAITIAAFRFSGDETGTVGDTVQITNSDSVSHTWTSTDGAFHSGVIGAGETFTHTFDDAGTYPYFCQIHTEMSGSITIEG
ncbi:MAG: cupredoxin domain-containing protein [Acidimicrobiia bacterium]